ncbi:MAG TPA: diaminobutyrate acetyltransferase [Pseudonocardia sp.]|jgi:L-2,4-diaminobutyric acid acetyltransferase
MKTYGIDAPPQISIEQAVIEDGVAMHLLAAETEVLDVNSRYAYLLWCRDFASTSVVARRAGDEADDSVVVGFVTGYRRPEEPNTLLVWQVAVAEEARGQGLAGRMLDSLWDQVAEWAPIDHMETTVTPDNDASIAMFTAFAKRHDTDMARTDLFDADLLSADGEDHEPEQKYRIGPITPARSNP